MTAPAFRVGRYEQIPYLDTSDPRELRRALAEVVQAMRDLSRMSEQWFQELAFGPVPGAYFPIHLRSDDAPLTTSTVEIGYCPVPCTAIAFVAVSSGMAPWAWTFTLKDSASSTIITGQISDTNADFRKFEDFTAVDVPAGILTLTIGSIDSGTPNTFRGALIVKGLAQMEDLG